MVNGLPTKQRRANRGVAVPKTCELCNQATEDAKHLFLECTCTTNLVQKIDTKIRNDIYTKNQQAISFEQKVYEIFEKFNKKNRAKLATTWWCVWIFHNKIVFNDTNVRT